MFKAGFILATDAHIDAAIFNRAHVSVYQRSSKGIMEPLFEGGIFESDCEMLVKMAGGYLLKANCEFRLCNE
ncbi:hypothetical protein [Paenibacillus whitsoniae]|uniref:Uncharacterized protein n=1 Tax=Paenibacillus whitsoniae TaxID=2496558 RepID=A0A430JCA4_9BACL|nr:hypothetical protein [Paenibacillus whitsoniae]RTE08641.1 hypothetical protein EJQ19_16270 [Paenibacillus whitsoniae]